ncbi:MAG: hypothetical protein D4R38_02710 [Dehalococcoidia bacterium]|nr:MAG: hypothetical protein D4R38_02710 [Dehalococcoidia bacterium]
MNEPELKTTAYFLAEHTPQHLGQPTTPPIHWDLEGDILRVLLADGREVRAPYSASKVEAAFKAVMAIPKRSTETVTPPPPHPTPKPARKS